MDKSDLCAQAFILIENFNHCDTYWRDNTVGHKQSWRLLKCTEKNFQIQIIEQPMRRDAVLDVIAAKSGSVGM